MLADDKYIMINALKLQGAIEVEEEVNGQPEKGIFLPYKDYMNKVGKNYFLCFNMREMKYKSKRTHMVYQQIDKIAYNNLKRLGYFDYIPRCGYGYNTSMEREIK